MKALKTPLRGTIQDHGFVDAVTAGVARFVTPELSNKAYVLRHAAEGHHMAGYCYVVAEVSYHLLKPLMAPDADFYPRRCKVGTVNHWFLYFDTHFFDPTRHQFEVDVDHHASVRAAFLTKQPSARAREVIRRMQACQYMKHLGREWGIK